MGLMIMKIEKVLAGLGVTDETLSADEKKELDENGYVVFPGILSAEQVARFNARFDELLAQEGAEAGKEMHQEAGTERLASLVEKDVMFTICYTHPKVLAAVHHVLGDFKLSELASRFAMPGQGAQKLHTDGHSLPDGSYIVCNTFWLLDDFTEENGPTRVVPGTHRSGETPNTGNTFNPNEDDMAPYPGEVKVLAPAGTVVVFNSHLWHGGTVNRTDKRRRALSAFYYRRDQTSLLNQRGLSEETLARLSPEARYILDA